LFHATHGTLLGKDAVNPRCQRLIPPYEDVT
jgi:hypothetical protein